MEIPDNNSLEAMLEQLAEVKTEIRKKNKAHKNDMKHLIDTAKSLENIVTSEVMKLQKTVTVGNIKAEYVPQVRIRLKKVNDDE